MKTFFMYLLTFILGAHVGFFIFALCSASGCASNEEECKDIKKKLDVIESSPKRETQDESISKFADGEWWKEVRE